MNDFSTLEKIVNFYLKDKLLADLLEKGKHYLKIYYLLHYTKFALSLNDR